jgi:outer membrane lipoprotein-sorting protein
VLPRRCVLLALAAAVCARGASLDDVLARMDGAAKQFKSYSAAARVLEYTKIVDGTHEKNGSFRLRRIKNGVGGIMDLTEGPDRTVLHFNGPELEIYLPKAEEIQVYKVGQYTAMVNRMLLLGFSVGRDDLKKDYDASFVGAETADGIPTSHIALTPKSPEALKYVRKIELWIDAKGNAIRQRVTKPSGDTQLVDYSNLQVNPALPDSEFELNVPPGVTKVKEN